MYYKNVSYTAKTFYGVTFEPGETKKVDGIINNRWMVPTNESATKATSAPQKEPSSEQPKEEPKPAAEPTLAEPEVPVEEPKEEPKEESKHSGKGKKS